jgi:hypothetical protein
LFKTNNDCSLEEKIVRGNSHLASGNSLLKFGLGEYPV